jgi:hypothetical protein
MVLVVAAACDSDGIEPPSGSWNAAATMECIGPLSESGVAIYLADAPVESPEPPAPYVRIIIREDMLERLSARTYVLAGSRAEGAAWSFSTGTNPEIATSGTVTVNSVAPDNTIEGWADLTFPSRGRVGGNFQARWFPRVQYCL